MKEVRWGIVGCGDVCEVKSGPGFQKAEGSKLVAVMRRDGGKAEDFARRHGVGKWYDRVEDLIGDAEVDAVYVATPPGVHEEVAMKVLAAGKACYVEKPMARNASEARRMVEGFKAKGVPLFVGYYRRALPRFLKVREVLRSGVLGEITLIRYAYGDPKVAVRQEPVPWRFQPEVSGGGLFMDLGSHALDLLDFWFGPLRFHKSKAANIYRAYEVEDVVTAGFECSSKARCVVTCCFGGAEGDFFAFHGTNGILKAPCFSNREISLDYRDGRRETWMVENPAHVHQPLIQTIVHELRGVGRCESTGESGLRTQVIMDQVLEGYYGGREDGFWRREWPGAKG